MIRNFAFAATCCVGIMGLQLDVERSQERSHDDLKKEVFDVSQQVLSEWDNLEVVIDIPEKNYVAKVKYDGDGPITMISHIKADGFTFEQFKVYYYDPFSIEPIYDGRVKNEKVGGETTESTSS